MKTLVVGYGNPMRCDDGAGFYIAREIEKAGLPDVKIRTVHQLQVEIVEDFKDTERVIFADAREEGPEYSLEKIYLPKSAVVTSSHHVGPEFIGILAKKIYGYEPELFLCTVRGESFEYKNRMTEAGLARAARAVKKIESLIQKEARHA